MDLARELESCVGYPVRILYPNESSVILEIETDLTDLSDLLDIVNAVTDRLRAAGYRDYVRVDILPRSGKHLIVLKCSSQLRRQLAVG